MNLKTIVAGVFILVGLSLQAQTKKWTLEECVAYALEKNISLKQSELDLSNSEIDKLDAKGNYLPNISASASHSWNIGLNQNITTGLFENLTTQYSQYGLNANVNIFNGLRNVNTLRRSNMAILAAQYQLDDMKDNISLSVANAYLQVLFNRETLKVAQAQLAVTTEDIKRTKELVESGVVPRGDLLELEATAATQEQQIVNSENGFRLAKISLAQLLLIDDYDNFDVSERDYLIPDSDVMDRTPKEVVAKAMEVRNNIKVSQSNVDLAEMDLKIAKGAKLPTLSAFYGYGSRASYEDQRIGFEVDPDNPTVQIGQVESTGEAVVTANQRSIIGPHDPIFDQFAENDGHNFGLSLNVPILNGLSAKNGVKRREIDLEKRKLQLENDKLDLETKVNQAWTDTRGALKTFQAAEKTLEARRLSHQYAKERFSVGLMNAFEFSQAQARVDNAEAEVIRSKYDYIFKLKVLEFYFGLPITLE